MRKLIILLSLAVSLGVSARDRLYVENFSIATGETIQMPILLDNETTCSAFQTDLYLPDALQVTVEDEDYFIDLTHRASGNHIISVSPMSDGALRILVTSQSVVNFTGNSGAVALVELTAVSDVTNGLVELKNSLLVEESGQKHSLDNESAVVNESGSTVIGDLDDSGNVDVADLNIIINMMLEKAEKTPAADINSDGVVDVADMNIIINIILGKA